MSSSPPGSSGATVVDAETVEERLRARGRHVTPGADEARVVGALLGLGDEGALDVEAQRLGAVTGRDGHPRAYRLRERDQVGQRRGHAGGQERGDATRNRAAAMPSRAPGPPIASYPPQPWTWTSTKPGAMTDRPRVRRRARCRRSARPRRPTGRARPGPRARAVPPPRSSPGSTPAIAGRSRDRRPARRRTRRPRWRPRTCPARRSRSRAARTRSRAPVRRSPPDRLQQQVTGRGDSAAKHDPVRVEHHDGVGDADAQVAPDVAGVPRPPAIARASRCHGILDGRGAAHAAIWSARA